MAAQYPAALVTTTQLAELGIRPGSSVSTTVRSRFEELPIKKTAAASTANVAGTYANGTAGVGANKAVGGTTLTVDTVVIANNDRVLLKDQTTAFENGVYTATGVGTAVVLTRSIDADTSAKLSDILVEVSGGSVNGDTQWRGTATLPTVGTTALPFRRSRPLYVPGGPRDPWGAGALTVPVISQNMGRADAAGTYSLPLSAQQLLVGGVVAPAGRTVTNINYIDITAGAVPTIDWFALARQSDRLTMAHTANITTAPTAGIVTRALTATWTPNYDTPVWIVWSHSNATTAKVVLSSPTGNAAGNLVTPAWSATNGVTPTTTVPTDNTTVITAATTGVTSIPLFWLT
jgi:hypothetical protein